MKKHYGFTLLEMAIVLLIVALVAGAGLSLATALRTNQGISSTRTKQEAIKEALITFIARNQRLPCPATETLAPGAVGYGVESGGPSACGATAVAGGVQRGVVPWISLGLPDADALDGWNNRFSYFVLQAATANPTPAAPLSGMRGGIALHSGTPLALGLPATGNQINACSTTAGDNGCNIAAVVLILSHGRNGSSAFTQNGVQLPPPVATAVLELANTDTADASFVQTQYSDNTANPFDDMLLAMTPADLLGPLERNGSFQSAPSITNERMAAIRDSVILDIVDNNGIIPAGLPTPLPGTPPNDGWGPLLAFAYNAPVGVGTNVCAQPVGTSIFTLTSTGLDPASAGDDIAVTQNDVRIRTMINNKGIPCP
ncbi:MAG: type II secretion system protein [Gammaproteobacteria bacterium]